MNKVLIVSYYDWWENRHKYFYNWFEKKESSVMYITSNFNHISKQKKTSEDLPSTVDSLMLKVPVYKKNISFSRILSNLVFSIKSFKLICEKKPDIILFLIPSNFMGLVIFFYKKVNPKVKVIIDIIDLWPETLPIRINNRAALKLLKLWKSLRSLAIRKSDIIINECRMYEKILKNELYEKITDVLYLQKKDCYPLQVVSNIDVINFVYIGSINNIIDIEGIVDILKKISKVKNVRLDIIGCGESADKFERKIRELGITVINHGAIFNKEKKHEIMSKAHFGLNMMKKDVVVGLTTKSIDYLSENLPLINSIPEDTEILIEDYDCGYNIHLLGSDLVVEKIISLNLEKYNNMRQNAKKLFDEKFSEKVFIKNVHHILNQVELSNKEK